MEGGLLHVLIRVTQNLQNHQGLQGCQGDQRGPLGAQGEQGGHYDPCQKGGATLLDIQGSGRGGAGAARDHRFVCESLLLSGAGAGDAFKGGDTNNGDTTNFHVGKGALSHMMVGVIAKLAGDGLGSLPHISEDI